MLVEQPSTGDLNPKVLAEKEIEEAKAVFAKHGIQVLGATGASRTSSVILFGNVGKEKKRDAKTKEKEGGTKSVVSSKNKNCNKRINCDQCGKEMRADAVKNHKGSRFCKK